MCTILHSINIYMCYVMCVHTHFRCNLFYIYEFILTLGVNGLRRMCWIQFQFSFQQTKCSPVSANILLLKCYLLPFAIVPSLPIFNRLESNTHISCVYICAVDINTQTKTKSNVDFILFFLLFFS